MSALVLVDTATKVIPIGALRPQLIAEAFNVTNKSSITGVATNYYNFRTTSSCLGPRTVQPGGTPTRHLAAPVS
ncbi:MAG TPA: hypothetical protein VFT12_14035 [Thermoanaerobaculia bacterium]|nr:hypothetical protein [Thermoanaerobaculia bacterium]